MTFSNFDALYQWNSWFTEAHIETGGKDSISYTPCRQKLFVLCERGLKSVLLEKRIRNVYNFIRSVKTGPSALSAESANKLKYNTPSSEHFLCQPALCVHTVLTFTNGPSLVLGCEACNVTDIQRAQEPLQFYGNGLRRTTYKRLLEIQGSRGAAEWATQRDNSLNINTGVTEHLVALNNSNQPICISSKRGGPSGPSKKRQRSFRLSNQEAWYNEKKDQDNGN